jgi:hypothetical protein
MPPVGFEPRISAGERSWTYALDRAATGAFLSCMGSNVKGRTTEKKRLNYGFYYFEFYVFGVETKEERILNSMVTIIFNLRRR